MTEGLIDFSEWSKLDLRVGQIVKVEDIEDADKLYKLTVDLGDFGKHRSVYTLKGTSPKALNAGVRIVCAGLKQHYDKNDLLDKRIILFVNLTPRKMKGIESQGMILAAVNEKEDNVVLIVPENEIELGSRVR